MYVVVLFDAVCFNSLQTNVVILLGSTCFIMADPPG